MLPQLSWKWGRVVPLMVGDAVSGRLRGDVVCAWCLLVVVGAVMHCIVVPDGG